MKLKQEQENLLQVNDLSNKILMDTWEMAYNHLKVSIKDRHETHEQYLAKCWIEGFKQALFKSNKIIYLKQKEIL